MFMSWDYVGASWSIQEKSVEGGGLAFVYLLKSLMLVMPLLLLVQGIADSMLNIRTLISPSSIHSSAQSSVQQGEG
jgi:TRAP-type mannitol/chloroaromatic compound transport system permease small subunit